MNCGWAEAEGIEYSAETTPAVVIHPILLAARSVNQMAHRHRNDPFQGHWKWSVWDTQVIPEKRRRIRDIPTPEHGRTELEQTHGPGPGRDREPATSIDNANRHQPRFPLDRPSHFRSPAGTPLRKHVARATVTQRSSRNPADKPRCFPHSATKFGQRSRKNERDEVHHQHQWPESVDKKMTNSRILALRSLEYSPPLIAICPLPPHQNSGQSRL